MDQKLKHMTIKELQVQIALGSLPEEYRNAVCRYRTPKIAKGIRKCTLCGLKYIHKGEEYYEIMHKSGRYSSTTNICKTCSWLTIQTINRIIDNHNTQTK